MGALKKMKSKIIMAAVMIIVMALGIGIYNTPANRINRHLGLGQKYLEELYIDYGSTAGGAVM